MSDAEKPMTGRDPIWDALHNASKAKFDADRARFLEEACEADDGGWTKHTAFHWSREVPHGRLDFWPSRKKFQHRGKVRRGDVYAYIRSLTP